MIDIAKLRELAEAATPGPWGELRCTLLEEQGNKRDSCGIASAHLGRNVPMVDIVRSDNDNECSHPMRRADAEYIAAAHPPTVIWLLDEVLRLQKLADERWSTLVHVEAELRRERDARAALRVELNGIREQLEQPGELGEVDRGRS